MPTNWLAVGVAGFTPVSLPAMIPAMCVPWPYVSRLRVDSDCDSNDRSGP